MAIRVKFGINASQRTYFDPVSGLRLNHGDTSPDLTGQDCRGIIKELGQEMPILELLEGSLAPVGLEDTVTTETDTKTYSFVAVANRKARIFNICNLGDGDVKFRFDGEASANGFRLVKGQSWNETMDYPLSYVEVSLASGASATYRMEIE